MGWASSPDWRSTYRSEPSSSSLRAGYELRILLIAAFFVVVTAGPGPLALDRLLGLEPAVPPAAPSPFRHSVRHQPAEDQAFVAVAEPGTHVGHVGPVGSVSSADPDDPALQCRGDSGRAVGDAELGVDVQQVGLDRGLRQT